MNNPFSKDIERKKAKEESEYMKEVKAKTAYKKRVENVFETIQKIKKEKEKIKEEEYLQSIKLREKCIEIGWFPIKFKPIQLHVNKLLRNADFQFVDMTADGRNETLDFIQRVAESLLDNLDETQDELEFYREREKQIKVILDDMGLKFDRLEEIDEEAKE